MIRKTFAIIACSLGLLMIVFAILAYRELHLAGQSNRVPQADSMPLTNFIYPDFFATVEEGGKPVHPADLAQSVLNRIYVLGFASLALFVTGIAIMAMPRGSRTAGNNP